MERGSLRKHLEVLYPEHVDRILELLKELPLCKHTRDPVRAIYVTYPNTFDPGSAGSFDKLAAQLPAIKALGCNAIHVLPFLKSPGIDAGFDISDFYHVDEAWGGDAAFDRFLHAAHGLGMTVFMDLVLNHVSEEHEWFKKAESDDKYYRNFFVYTHKQPVLVEVASHVDSVYGNCATYVFNENKHVFPIIFPEQAGEIPHFRKGKDGWYYHTFYPHQIDLDWTNPEVFVTMAKVVVHWAQRGVCFRIDAIDMLGKDVWSGEARDSPRAHHIITALRHIAAEVYPQVMFLAEAYHGPGELIKYFGIDIVESDLAYDFLLASSLWHALLLEDNRLLWDSLQQRLPIPAWAQFVVFLRNHDTLAYKFLAAENADELEPILMTRGMPFAKGNEIAARTASLLQHDEDAIILAHALLASMPGIPAIFYGDEYGKENDVAFMKARTKEKQARTSEPVNEDARDLSRGFLASELRGAKGKRISAAIGTIFATREKFEIVSPIMLHAPKSVFAASYHQKDKTLTVLCNLSKNEASLHKDGTIVLALNGATLENSKAFLPGHGVLWIVS